MSAAYVPQVGDRVMVEGETATVLGIDNDVAWVKWEHDGYRTTMFVKHLANALLLPTYPERWINVYNNYTSYGIRSRSDADASHDTAIGATRLAVIHLAADGTLTLHPVERDQ